MVKGHLELLLLSVLRRGPQHGYAVITTLRDLSDGAFDLPEGTIYPALHKLESDGLVTSEWTVIDGRRRRVYALSAGGRAANATRRREWTAFARGVDLVVA